MRQVILDVETTGLKLEDGNRIVEIGCVEIENNLLTDKTYQQYLNPGCAIEDGASQIHGLSAEFLKKQPIFADIVDDFLHFVKGAELIIHYAPFDVAFINHELALLGLLPLERSCKITDSYYLAKTQLPLLSYSLDTLCHYYDVDFSDRKLHGALKDCKLLAQVYLKMTTSRNAHTEKLTSHSLFKPVVNENQQQETGSNTSFVILRRA